MAVPLSEIRSLLLPGLWEVSGNHGLIANQWAEIFAESIEEIAKPTIWVPKLTLPQAVAVGAAAAVIKNPMVTRRFWQGWLSPKAVDSSESAAEPATGLDATNESEP